jgi:hypothetical protein
MNIFLVYILAGVEGLQDLIDLIKYFAFTISEGDYLNDWLTHLPPDLADAARVIGEWLANLNL